MVAQMCLLSQMAGVHVDGKWTVYVLQSEAPRRSTWGDANGRNRGRNGRASVYVGMTCDLKRRLRQHNGELVGGARRTTSGRPWKVLATVSGFADIRAALRAEWRVKRARGNLVQAVVGRARWTSRSDPFASESLSVTHRDVGVSEEVVRIVSLVGACWRVKPFAPSSQPVSPPEEEPATETERSNGSERVASP